MRSISRVVVFAFLFGVFACVALAAEAPAPPAAVPAPPETPSVVPAPVDEEPPSVEPAGDEGAQPADEGVPALDSTAPAGKVSQAAKDRQTKIYENYERLARVMEIVESRYVQPVDSEQLFDGAIEGIMNSLDPYSAYIPAEAYTSFVEDTEQQFTGVGITIAAEKDRVKVVSTLEGMPAFRAGVQPGDIFRRIDDVPIEEIGTLDKVSKALRGPEESNVTITFLRPSTAKEYTVTLTREAIQITTLKGYKCDAKTGKWDFMIDKNAGVGYIRITKFGQNTADELDSTYAALVKDGMKALILDFRYNPGGLLDAGIAVADRFVDDGLIVRTQGRAGVHSESYAKPGDTYRPKLPLVVLVNEFSASASEVVGGALQDHKRAVLVGNRTFGKGSVQNMIDLDGKGALKLTIAYYYTPSGRLVHRLPGATQWGLDPDFKLPMTIENQIKLREDWSNAASGVPPTSLGEDGSAVLDIQLARAVEVAKGTVSKDADTKVVVTSGE